MDKPIASLALFASLLITPAAMAQTDDGSQYDTSGIAATAVNQKTFGARRKPQPEIPKRAFSSTPATNTPKEL